jgi:FixJ family two-component response regulator
MSSEPTVFVVDDDSAVRGAISRLLKSVGLKPVTYGSAQEFLDDYDRSTRGCLVLDVRMPGMGGLDLQQSLADKKVDIPIVIITGHADVPMAVRALQMGAVNFIEKPFSDQLLLDSIQQAIKKDADRRRDQARRTEIEELIAQLTPREREVMDMVIAGKTNKSIALDLRLSKKTVEFHRGNVMKKMNVDSVVELIRLFVKKEEIP